MNRQSLFIFAVLGLFNLAFSQICTWNFPLGFDIVSNNVIAPFCHMLIYQAERLTDLRTPSPVSVVESLSVTGCFITSGFVTQALTAWRLQTPYVASPVTYTEFGNDIVTAYTHIFSSLVMTVLTPGDMITIVLKLLVFLIEY